MPQPLLWSADEHFDEERLVGELIRRVHEVAVASSSNGDPNSDAPLTPRAAAKAERLTRTEHARQAQAEHREAERAETSRRSQLAQILNTFRASVKSAGDVGTIGFDRAPTFKDRRLRLGRHPRGWIVGVGSVPMQFQDGVHSVDAQLVLGVDGRLYAAIDDVIGSRYQIGQLTPPPTTWVLSPQIWALVEATIPDTVGASVAQLSLEWSLD